MLNVPTASSDIVMRRLWVERGKEGEAREGGWSMLTLSVSRPSRADRQFSRAQGPRQSSGPAFLGLCLTNSENSLLDHTKRPSCE